MSIRLKHNNTGITYFHLTLNDNYIGTITTGLTYSVQFTKNTDSITHEVEVIDGSIYPDVYNKFGITTDIVTTGETNAQLEQGWYIYKVYTWADRTLQSNRLALGQCYVYDNDERPGNIPDDIETYTETKSKYVYSRD